MYRILKERVGFEADIFQLLIEEGTSFRQYIDNIMSYFTTLAAPNQILHLMDEWVNSCSPGNAYMILQLQL